MRTIKFRAKSVEGHNIGEWVFGDLHIRSAFSHIHTDVGTRCKIDPNTIGEFTGLSDKNGKEIYEGDIYRYDNPDSINEVSYCAGGGFAGFDFSPAKHDENRLLDIEVIGNIHDNPEKLIEDYFVI